ncbi:hypothetical protein RSOL_397900, partial [Rhizoctonia solani AG-3 Rhs1AP]
MSPPPETPRKRIRTLRNEQSSPEYILKPPPCKNWADNAFQFCDTIRDAFIAFTEIRMTDTDKAAPEMLLNALGNIRLTLTDMIVKVDSTCNRIVTYNPELASELALHNKQTQTDGTEPVTPPPQQTYASVAVAHTPLQERPRPQPTMPSAKHAAAKPTSTNPTYLPETFTDSWSLLLRPYPAHPRP